MARPDQPAPSSQICHTQAGPPPRHHPPAMALREIRYRYRHPGFAYTPPALPDRDSHKDLISSHAVPSAPGHEGVHSHTTVQAKRRSRQPTTATNKNGPPQGPIKEICTHSEAHKPLNRENTCPRWDSNCIPALANTGNSRKHSQSEPVRHLYGPVRRPKCGQCTHPKLTNPEHGSHQPHTRRVLRDLLLCSRIFVACTRCPEPCTQQGASHVARQEAPCGLGCKSAAAVSRRRGRRCRCTGCRGIPRCPRGRLRGPGRTA